MAHENTTYIIVPSVDITKELVDLCCENSLETVRHSKDGRAILKFVQYKDSHEAMPSKNANDLSLTSYQMEYNKKMAIYSFAHKTTPEVLKKYIQYSYADILKELDKDEWKSDLDIDPEIIDVKKDK